ALGGKLMERFGKKVSYGIGVNCGEAIIGNIGSNFRMDYTAIGDTVNTASRLESNAKAGEILISEEVKKRLEGRIETEDVGEIPLKGKQNKIFVYRVKL
ncbi:MAG: adenylate/guanylate cyclase domain-containing protein, partial [Lachnospiraceae bacterium]|nr:adenylate/guanylate cyclase domain-containing protein [Lachnospiraceae bacterium]